MRPRVAIRVDAGPDVGFGHLLRMRSLAEAIVRRGAEVEFIGHGVASVVTEGSPWSATVLEAPVTEEAEDLSRTISLLASDAPDIVIVDHYRLGESWERGIAGRFKDAELVAVDDLEGRIHAVDTLIDPNLGPAGPKLASGSAARLLSGLAFVPLSADYRKPAEERPDLTASPSVLVSLGGGRSGIINRLAEALVAEPLLHEVAFDFVVPDEVEYEGVQRTLRGREGSIVHGHVPTLRPHIERADLVVGAGGSSTWQSLRLGRPSVLVTLAENQVRTGRALKELDLALCVQSRDSVRDIISAVHAGLEDQSLRRRVRDQGPLLVDGRGAERIAVALFPAAASPTLRSVEIADAAAIFATINTPSQLASDLMLDISHVSNFSNWFMHVLRTEPNFFWLVEVDALPVGIVLFQAFCDGWRLDCTFNFQKMSVDLTAKLFASAIRRLAEGGATGPIYSTLKVSTERLQRAILNLGFVSHSEQGNESTPDYARARGAFEHYVRR